MFNLNREVKRLELLEHTRIHGLPYKPKEKIPDVQHTDYSAFDTDAAREGGAISRGFKNRSMDFGLRLSKAKGQKHHPGGGV